MKSAEADLRETGGTHRSRCSESKSFQAHTPEMSLSEASSDLSNDFEKEEGWERRKEMSLSRSLTLSWCDG